MSSQNIRQFVPRNNFPLLTLGTYDMSLTSDEENYNQEVVFSPYLIAQTYGNRLPFYFDTNSSASTQNLILTYKNYNFNNVFISENYYNPKEEILSCELSGSSCDIGLTGIDNGLVTGMTGETIVFTEGLLPENLKFNRLYFDRRLKLHQVTGFTSTNIRFSGFDKTILYEVISKNSPYEGKYHELYGGFYQGFYKLFGYDYNIFPERMNKGWAVEMLLKPRLVNEYSGTTGETTLNEIYPNNKNIFFYIGTRAENKFYHHADGSPLCNSGYTRVTSGLTKLSTCACCDYNITNSRCIYVYPPRSVNGVHDPHINYGCDKCGGNPETKITCGCDCNELPCQTCGWECQTHTCGTIIPATPTPTPSPTPTPYCDPFPPQTTCTPTCTDCVECTDCNDCSTSGFTSIEDTCEKDPMLDSMSNGFAIKLCGDPKNPGIGIRFLRFTGGCETTGTCTTGITYTTGYTITEICTPPIYPDCERINPAWLNEEHWFQVNVVWERYNFLDECDLYWKGGLGDIVQKKTLEGLANNSTALIAPPYTRGEEVLDVDIINLNELWLQNEKYRKGRLKIYVNGKIFYTIEDFEEIIPRALNTDKEKQVGVPFNISWGGGTQGLRENLTFTSLSNPLGPYQQDPELFPINDLSGTTLSGLNTNILIEQNFAGTFEGAISQFRMYITPLSAPEIKHNFNLLKNTFRMFNPDCPDCTTIPCLPNDLTYTITEPITTTTTTVITQPLTFFISISVVPGSIVGTYTIRMNKLQSNDITISFVCGFRMIDGRIIYDNQNVVIKAGQLSVNGTIRIEEPYTNFGREVIFSEPVITGVRGDSEVNFNFESTTGEYVEILPTPTPTTTPTNTPTSTPTNTPTTTPTNTPTNSVTPTPTLTPRPTRTATPTVTPTNTPTPTISVTPSVSASPNLTPTATPTISVTPTPTVTPTMTPIDPTETLMVMLDFEILEGSIIINAVATLPRILPETYTKTFTKELCTNVENNFEVTGIITIPAGEISGSTQIVLNEDYECLVDEIIIKNVIHHIPSNGLKFDTIFRNVKYGKSVPKPSVTPTNTPTSTPTLTPTSTPTNTPTTTPTSTPTNTPTPSSTSTPIVAETTIYYGKLSAINVTIDNISGFSSVEQTSGVNYHLNLPSGAGYGYILIPQYMTQPSMFRDSVSGCNGFVIPIINQDMLEIIDNSGNTSIYRVYRTYVSTSASLNIWLCE